MPRRSRPSGWPSTTSPRPSSKGAAGPHGLRALVEGLPPEKLDQALAHPSWTADRLSSYERLEFLGDSVLGLTVARMLFERFPDFSEGRMTRIRADLVSRAGCAAVARELGLDAQLAAERNSKPGMLAAAAQDSSFDIRAKGLAKLGLIESEDATLDFPWPTDCTANPRGCKQSNFWMIHGISHGIGLAVHDPAQSYYGDRRYKEGDAFTIEPGIYVSTSMLDALPDTPTNRAFVARVKSVVQRYENSGVRIEDDYIITDKGLERISNAPREIAEIEALMAKRPARAVP